MAFTAGWRYHRWRNSAGGFLVGESTIYSDGENRIFSSSWLSLLWPPAGNQRLGDSASAYQGTDWGKGLKEAAWRLPPCMKSGASWVLRVAKLRFGSNSLTCFNFCIALSPSPFSCTQAFPCLTTNSACSVFFQPPCCKQVAPAVSLPGEASSGCRRNLSQPRRSRSCQLSGVDQSLSVLSSLPLSRVLPSRLNATALTELHISLEMLDRGLYHFSVAHQKGIATNPVKYFATPENQDLGIVKQQRKPNLKLIVAPFPEQQQGSDQFFFKPFLKSPWKLPQRLNLSPLGSPPTPEGTPMPPKTPCTRIEWLMRVQFLNFGS